MPKRRHVLTAALLAAAMFGGMPAFAADAAPPPAAPAKPALKTKLPDEKPDQQALRKFLGTLTEKDFDPTVNEEPKPVPLDNADDAYRTWLLSLDFPRVGLISHTERNAPGVNLAPKQFTLAFIENETRGVIQPALWPETVAWLANWKYPGNPYHGSRALKLRVFATASVDMLMMDDLQEHSAALMHQRADWFGPHLIMYGYSYAAVRDIIPAEGRAGFEGILKRMMQRVSKWGPQGDEGYLDISAVVGMRLAANALGDAESAKLAEGFAKRFFNDPWYYNPAGYFPEQGCFDAGFNGLSLFYATWLANAAPDWPFVQDAVKKAWRLRAHLSLPEPDGKFVGPSHFNSRTGSDVVTDQWDWPFRTAAAAFLTDDAICQSRAPSTEQLKSASATAVAILTPQIKPYTGQKLDAATIVSGPWRWMLYPDTPLFPMVNYAYEYYPKGFAAHREELTKNNSPLLKYPFQRDASFVETFDKSLLIAKKPGFGVVVHTGPISEFKGEGHVEFTGPYGLSGGSLSAFWTPSTGSVILGRRAGMQFPNRTPANFDLPEHWRTWPVHSAAGITAGGKFFTSARIQNPDAVYNVGKEKSSVKVTGVIPAVTIGTEKALDGKLDFARAFTLDEKGLSVETTVTGDGKDSVAELYEVFPVFLRDVMNQSKATPTTIEFEVGGKWAPATEQTTAAVTAIRLTRFDGAVAIRFDRARRAKLAPQWTDTFMTRASCQNVLVDLLENNDQPAPITKAKSIAYRIEPAAKP